MSKFYVTMEYRMEIEADTEEKATLYALSLEPMEPFADLVDVTGLDVVAITKEKP